MNKKHVGLTIVLKPFVPPFVELRLEMVPWEGIALEPFSDGIMAKNWYLQRSRSPPPLTSTHPGAMDKRVRGVKGLVLAQALAPVFSSGTSSEKEDEAWLVEAA